MSNPVQNRVLDLVIAASLSINKYFPNRSKTWLSLKDKDAIFIPLAKLLDLSNVDGRDYIEYYYSIMAKETEYFPSVKGLLDPEMIQRYKNDVG